MARFMLPAIGIACLCLSGPAEARHQFVNIGTGAITGVYYAVGGAICRLLNKERKEHGIRCSVESTNGSSFNVAAILAGEMDFGLAQSDVQYDAYKGLGAFKERGPANELRSVFSVHAEPFTVAARKELNVRSFGELKGKRINVGSPGSGTRLSLDRLLDALGLSVSDFAAVYDLKADEHGAALCDNRIDAFVYAVGHPSANLQDTTTNCGARLVPVAGPGIDKLLAEHPYYARTAIAGGIYANNPEPTSTYGVVATLVASAASDSDVVYQLVKSTFDNFDEFTRLHPALIGLKAPEMVASGLSAPLHAGAARYYREKGWIK